MCCTRKLSISHSLRMVVDKVWVNTEKFQCILSIMTKCGLWIHHERFHSLLFRWALTIRVCTKGGEFCRKSLFHSSSWTYGHNVTHFTGYASGFNGVYINQLVIHLGGLLLITWHRNKHCLSLPVMITKPGENWFESFYLYQEANSTNRAVQNATVKVSIQIKEQQKGISIIN